MRSDTLEFLYIDDFGKNNEELGDGIIIDKLNKVVVVFEAKSRQFPSIAKSDGDLKMLTDDLIIAAKQLDQAIQKLKEKGLQVMGIDPEGYKFFPILTFYESIPSNEALQRYFRAKFKEHDLFNAENVAEPEITGIAAIESAYEIEKSLPEILVKKHETKDCEEDHLGGYIAVNANKFKFKFLEDEFKEMFNLMGTIIKAKT